MRYLKKLPSWTGVRTAKWVKGRCKEKRKQHVDVVVLKSSEKNRQCLDCHFPAYFRSARIFREPIGICFSEKRRTTGHADETRCSSKIENCARKIEKGNLSVHTFSLASSGWLFVDAVKLNIVDGSEMRVHSRKINFNASTHHQVIYRGNPWRGIS